MTISIRHAKGAENNAFATMLGELVRQNLESKPHKVRDFDAIEGSVALVADDAEVALTMVFRRDSNPPRGSLCLHDGIVGIPDVTVRGSADAIMALSNVPLTRRWGLPIPADRDAVEVLRGLLRASLSGELRVYGMWSGFSLLQRLTRIMSVNG